MAITSTPLEYDFVGCAHCGHTYEDADSIYCPKCNCESTGDDIYDLYMDSLGDGWLAINVGRALAYRDLGYVDIFSSARGGGKLICIPTQKLGDKFSVLFGDLSDEVQFNG